MRRSRAYPPPQKAGNICEAQKVCKAARYLYSVCSPSTPCIFPVLFLCPFCAFSVLLQLIATTAYYIIKARKNRIIKPFLAI